MIRLLAIDIDGTLLDSDGALPEANQRAIAGAIGCGVEVALATDRRYDFARGIFEQFPSPLLNDVEMLEFAGTPVVMGNAVPDLETRGWFEADSNDGEGVAHAVETFILHTAS